jgi:hypothetical protein
MSSKAESCKCAGCEAKEKTIKCNDCKDQFCKDCIIDVRKKKDWAYDYVCLTCKAGWEEDDSGRTIQTKYSLKGYSLQPVD